MAVIDVTDQVVMVPFGETHPVVGPTSFWYPASEGEGGPGWQWPTDNNNNFMQVWDRIPCGPISAVLVGIETIYFNNNRDYRVLVVCGDGTFEGGYSYVSETNSLAWGEIQTYRGGTGVHEYRLEIPQEKNFSDIGFLGVTAGNGGGTTASAIRYVKVVTSEYVPPPAPIEFWTAAVGAEQIDNA